MLSREGLAVLRHYLDQGLPKTVIATKLGVSRRTVLRYEKSGEAAPRYGPRPPRPSKLDPFKSYIRGRLEAFPELRATRLFAELGPLGYLGSYTLVKRYVRSVRPRGESRFEVRFEAGLGEQAQVDFAVFKTQFGTVYGLLAVLSWSRALYVRFVLHQDQAALLAALHRAFAAFGGVPRTVLFDRMKAAVAGSGPGGRAEFNAEMLRFASHYGFEPRACRPYRAKTKGKVERAVLYVRQGFFYGRQFRDLADMNLQAADWLAQVANVRVHGTTGEAPSYRLTRERGELRPMPQEPYAPLLAVGRRVAQDGFISYNGNDYSVPDGTGRTEVEVRAALEELRLFASGRLIATHLISEGRGVRVLTPGHRSGAQRAWQSATGERDAGSYELVEVEKRPLDVYESVLA